MEDLRKKLIKRILNDCERCNVSTTKDFVSFLFTLFQLNPAYEMKKDDDYHNDNIVAAIVEKLSNRDSPSLTTLKYQLYFFKHYREREETVQRHRLRLHKKTEPMVAEICKTDKISNSQQSEKLYQKMLVVITVLSGLGNPTISRVLREVSVTLQSVFQPSELEEFVKMSRQEKEEHLMELMCLVAGIRLFNRDCQRGGEGIDDLPTILQEAVKKTHDFIMEFLEQLMSKIYKFTMAVQKIILMHEIIPFGIFTHINITWAKEMLTACRQQEIYVRKLLKDVEQSDKQIQELLEKLQARLLKLHDTVKFRTATPIVQVYPQFIDLANIWMGLQDEVIILSNINNFFWEFQHLGVEVVGVYYETILNDMLVGEKVLTDAQRLEKPMDSVITKCGECTIYYPDKTKNFENINLEFLGFCVWTFMQSEGGLIPGNPNLGIVKWRGKCYVFASNAAAKNFGRDPDKCINMALHFICHKPEYVYLFQVYNDIQNLETHQISPEEEVETIAIQNQMVQTDLHILPPFIDKNYTSSIWELRRRALHLASISHAATRSTQTDKSNFRYGVYVQASPPRDKEVQTRRDNYMNTKKLLTYIFGLRGRKDDTQHVLSFLEDDLEHL